MISWIKALLPIIVMTLSLVLIYLSICLDGLAPLEVHRIAAGRSNEAVLECLLDEGCAPPHRNQARTP